MKKLLLFTIMMQAILVSAQSPVTMPAGNGTTSPSNACLACPGSGWNNEMNITALDGVGADASLMQNGFCFQSNCFTSRYLMATQFGFSVPGTATMVGIEVSITRKATDTTAIKDSVVQLTTGGAPAGANKKSIAYWDTLYTTVTYGGPADLWGSSSSFWTPAAINSTTTGVNLKILNLTASSTNSNYVDYISMTVYFSNSTGIIESQTSVSELFYVSQAENKLQFHFTSGNQSQNHTLKLYDDQGQIIFTKNVGTNNGGHQAESIEITDFSPGIYLAYYSNGAQQLCKKVVLVK